MNNQYYQIISTGEEYEADGKWHNVILEPVDIGWRSVDDELPKENTSVIYDIDNQSDTWTAYYKKHGDSIVWYDEVYGSIVDVTHWCKIPEPIKEVEHE